MQHNIIKSVKIRSIQWIDEYVIFDQLSGDTHLLDSISGELIVSLSERAMSKEELLNKLSEWFEDLAAVELNNYLDDFIERFAALGLLDIPKQSV